MKVQKTGRHVACLLSMSACPLRSTTLNWIKLFCISYKFSFVRSLLGIFFVFNIFKGRGDIVHAKMSNVLKSFGTNIYMLLQDKILKVQKTWYREEKMYSIETTLPALHCSVLHCTISYCNELYCTKMWSNVSTATVKNYSGVGLQRNCTALHFIY